MTHPVIEAIHQRRSIRSFTDQPVSSSEIQTILEAAQWAPSGMNNQPWRFVVVESPAKKKELGECTKYSRVVETAGVCVAVFLDHEVSYNATKDHQAIGAALQNMLLTVHALGLGAVWLGEILKNADRVREVFELDARYELMAVVAIGRVEPKDRTSDRRPLDELILGRW